MGALKIHGHELKLILNTLSMWLRWLSPATCSMAMNINLDLRIRIFLKNTEKEEKGREVSGVWKVKWMKGFRPMILFIVKSNDFRFFPDPKWSLT